MVEEAWVVLNIIFIQGETMRLAAGVVGVVTVGVVVAVVVADCCGVELVAVVVGERKS